MSDDTNENKSDEQEQDEPREAKAVVASEIDAAATVPNDHEGHGHELDDDSDEPAAGSEEPVKATSKADAEDAEDAEDAKGEDAEDAEPDEEGPEEATPEVVADGQELSAKEKAIASVSAAVATISPEPAPSKTTGARRTRRKERTFYVVGFWRRGLAAFVDLAVVVPLALVLIWLSSLAAGLELPASNHQGPDYWLDLFLASHPALMGGLGLLFGIGCLYVLIFQITMGRTLGMLVLKTRIIDVYGDPPSSGRAVARTAGYMAGFATLSLGFLWIGFDSEKRGLHDWLSGTYVVKA